MNDDFNQWLIANEWKPASNGWYKVFDNITTFKNTKELYTEFLDEKGKK
ncbi:MAG TPA: hypothetical protein VNX68_07100 [Nitrosopumilaceae archaeon]|jgi:hypothetical protein|nr:hypothetical protein [Nitrosopumilaceae archaeon]